MSRPEYRLQDIIALLRHANMSSSYKPALLAAMVNRAVAGQLRNDQIALDELAEEYLKMYWSQVVIYRLRHSPRDSAPPVIVQLIVAASGKFGTRRLDDLPVAERVHLVGSIARVLPINVLSAFHSSKPRGMPDLYVWGKGRQHIVVPPETASFFRTHSSVLTLVANYYWARFLSRLNAAPYIVDKLERLSPRRSSLARFARQLAQLGESACFYCGKKNLVAGDLHLDHFIPWTFVFEDKLWNLVVACQACNREKSDGLPADDTLRRLVALNKIRSSFRQSVSPSMKDSEVELARLYDLAREERWPTWLRTKGATGSEPL